MIYSYSSLMDREPIAIWLELAKSILGLGIIYQLGSWFYLDEILTGASIFMIAYFILSVLIVACFVYYEIQASKISPFKPSGI